MLSILPEGKILTCWNNYLTLSAVGCHKHDVNAAGNIYNKQGYR